MKFLILEMKTVCYNSYYYFAERLGESLKNAGNSVEFFRMSEEEFDNLEQYTNQSFDAIFDFNSDMPRALLDDDSYFLDHIDAPFFDFILDHPLYHHDSLCHKLTNFHVICLDYNHKKFIETYYPHIKSITVLPVTGSCVLENTSDAWKNWEYRKYDVVFCGSYTSPNKISDMIEKLPADLYNTTTLLIDMLLQDKSLTIEAAINEIYANSFYDYQNSTLKLFQQPFCLADSYVRCLNRHNLIEALDNTQYSLHLFGSFWNEMNLKYATVHKEMPFNTTFSIFSNSKISVNIMPNFKAGFHDRIFSAQLNGAVSFTDNSTEIEKIYTNSKNILTYNLDNLAEVPMLIESALNDPKKIKKIAQEGYVIANKSFTWTIITEQILNILKLI